MAEQATDWAPSAAETDTPMPTVIAASCAGTAFEWYDFFIFGSLIQIISKTFFAELGPTAGLIASLALFGVGFAFRPIGALIFGGLGDRIGRKSAFLITVTMMGASTFAIGLLPTFAQVGEIAPLLLVLLRMVQGAALGGQYGGAAIYVAEHASPGRRGFMTAWVQASAAFGLVGALSVIFLVRKSVGETAFAAWGWRLPFFVSAGLVAVSIWMRLRLSESPAFARMKAAGNHSRAPYAEAFGRWPNIRLILIAFFGVMCAQGAYWYTVFFYAEVFLEKFLKVDGPFANMMVMIAAIVSAPLYVFFGWLSDRVGRKWVMWFGMALGAASLFPGFHLISQAANPALVAAAAKTPIVLVADPQTCSLQFDPTGKAKFVSGCDIAGAALANAGVSYRTQRAPAGAAAIVRLGADEVAVPDGRGLPAAALNAATQSFAGRLAAALARGGYPERSDPAARNAPVIIAVLIVFTIAATALYGPMAAALTELFPARVRYTALSLPYHLGAGWIGGFQPVASFAIVVATGDIYAGLWYPAAFTLVSIVACVLFLPETRGRSLEA
jgi:MFS family permease